FDHNNNPSPSVPHTVNKADTGVALTSPVNPSEFGHAVTFRAKVTAASPGGGVPTGDVKFFDGGVEIGTGTLNANGVATFTTSSLSVGGHKITARYLGDGNFNEQTKSNELTQSVL